MEAAITTMAIVTGRGKRAIEDHFDVSYELEHQIRGTEKEKMLADIRDIIDVCTFSYTRQIEMKGLGHAILTGETLIGDEPFAVVLADDLCINKEKGVLAQMVELFKQYQCCVVAIEEIDHADTEKYGIIDGEEIEKNIYRVTNMVEKPHPSEAKTNLAIIGRYILTSDIFAILRETKPGKGGEIQITDALLQLAKAGKVIAYKFDGKRYDCGSIDGYVRATVELYHLT